ncbi:MAG: hypothetical protein V8S33_02100 [Intestinibacter bartlettii]
MQNFSTKSYVAGVANMKLRMGVVGLFIDQIKRSFSEIKADAIKN